MWRLRALRQFLITMERSESGMKGETRRIITRHEVRSPKLQEPLKLAVAPDLHSGDWENMLEEILTCDALLLPGDLLDRHRRNNERAFRFLKEVPELLPVYYSVGNHEVKYRDQDAWRKAVRDSRAILLEDRSVRFRGISIGGLSSTLAPPPNMNFLKRFQKQKGFRLLMCHQPEVYRDYVQGMDFDFTVCGHAHGGQIQLFGRGLYAPCQGLFPKLTHGLHDGGRMMISRGMTNSAMPRIPRIGNPCELIVLSLVPQRDEM